MLHPPTFERVRDLEEFDGPILTELRRIDRGGTYVEKWCARDDSTQRTIVTRTDTRAVAEYLAGRLSMLDLLTITSDDIGFLVDYRELDVKTSLVVVSCLPGEYLPRSDVMHDPELRPHWKEMPQFFTLNKHWDARTLSRLEKLYSEVYTFAFLSSDEGKSHFPEFLLDYSYDSGFSYGAAIKTLRRHVPEGERPRTDAVLAASPGILRIAAPEKYAARIAMLLKAALRPETAQAYWVLHSWSKMKTLNADGVPSTARRDVTSLCSMLRLDAKLLLGSSVSVPSEGVEQEVPAPPTEQQERLLLLKAAKVVATYYRRLRSLASPEFDGVEFLAPLSTDGESISESPRRPAVNEPDGANDADDDYDDDDINES